MNRIQKLLLSDEYANFDDTVLVESPFAQVTDGGVGVRQVQLGLSPTKFLIATDVINPTGTMTHWRMDLDPEINTLELVSILPVDFVKLRICQQVGRQLLSVELNTGRVMLFEFGGFLHRQNYKEWWCDRIEELRFWQNCPSCTRFMSHSTSDEQLHLDLNDKQSSSGCFSDNPPSSDVLSSTSLLQNPSSRHLEPVSRSSGESWMYHQFEDITRMLSRIPK